MRVQQMKSELLNCERMEEQSIELKACECYCQKKNILLKQCEPFTPQHNGCSERANLEIEEKIRASLISAKMPNYFWAYALRQRDAKIPESVSPVLELEI